MKRLKKKKKSNHSNQNDTGPFFPKVQKKLSVGKADDAYEKEADNVAEKVISKTGDNGTLQTKSADEEQVQQKPVADGISTLQKQDMKDEEPMAQSKEEEKEPLQKEEEEEAMQQKSEEEEPVQKEEEEEAMQQKTEEEEPVQKEEEEEAAQPKSEEEEVQKKGKGGVHAPQKVESKIKATKGKGNTMDATTRQQMEQGFGASFQHIDIHTDSEAQKMSESLGAQAFTVGNDIYFNAGKYDPHSEEGKKLLAHELTHTIQQKGKSEKKVQKQQRPSRQQRPNQQQSGCRRLSRRERGSLRQELQAGIQRMQGFIQHPEQLIGQGRNQTQIANMTAHVNATITLARQCLRFFSGTTQECVAQNPCPQSADACFIPVNNQFRIKESTLQNINRYAAGNLLHEFKHFTQHQQHAEAVAASITALIHSGVNELGYEYEAALASAIFTGTVLQSNNSSGSGSGVPFYSRDIPQEAMRFGIDHSPGNLPLNESQIPVISRGYRDQVQRNSPVIHYPAEWSANTNVLTIRDPQGNRIRLGTFTQAEITAGIPVQHAFWNNTTLSQAYTQGNYRRGVITIYSIRGANRDVLKQVFVGTRRSTHPRLLQEGGTITERPI